MPILATILLLFIGIPLIEIYVLIEVGSAIGAFTTIFAVVFTAILGVAMIRVQGFSTLQKAQQTMNQGGVPAQQMFEGVMLLFAAVCLLIPGFFTDTMGFLLLIPPLRHYLAEKLIASSALRAQFQRPQNDFFEGEYEDLTETKQGLNDSVYKHKPSSSQTRQDNLIEGELDSDNK